MFKIGYSLNSAEPLQIEDVCNSLVNYGYSGVELSFQKEQFDPLAISDARINEIRDYFTTSLISPICISTATTMFLSNVPHEPSLINLEQEDRARRADLIKRGLLLAKIIGVPLVSFQSGYLRDEHAGMQRGEIMFNLSVEIKQLLSNAGDNVSLVIEPEPGMFIETISDAQELVDLVNDGRFGLHLDIGHVYCTEEQYIEAIKTNASRAKYIHIADIKTGFNMKFAAVDDRDIGSLIKNNTDDRDAILYDLNDSGLYLYIHGNKRFIVGPEALICKLDKKFDLPALIIEEEFLSQRLTIDIKQEIDAYLDSIPGVKYDRVLHAYGAVATLRLGNSSQSQVISDVVCNTIKGKVHYHERFGMGNIEYSSVFSALIESGYNGYCTVELYNHARLWREVAPASVKYILSRVLANFGWNCSDFGHIDHRTVIAPYVRCADANIGSEGGVAVLYDLRLSQPNKEVLPTNALHTLEHCFLKVLPSVLPGFVGVGPMGCQTGLYLTTAFPIRRKVMEAAIETVLHQICEMEEIPFQSEAMCGMAANHDLSTAKNIAYSVAIAMEASLLEVDDD